MSYAVVALGGCGGSDVGALIRAIWAPPVDGGGPPPDMAFVPPDMAFVPPDMAFVPPDMAFVPPDMAFVPPDMAFVPPDMAFVPQDLGEPTPDAAPACDDHEWNGLETDTDCGGPLCHRCVDGLECAGDSDCLSGHCEDGICEPPRYCSDWMLDGDETDVDCGGPWCQGCVDGTVCLVGSDCKSHVCSGGTCQAPSCGDGVMNGAEADVDCGGSCSPCPDGASCIFDGDCQSGWCGPEDSLCGAPKPPPPPPPPACDCDSCKDIQKNGGTLPNPTKCKVKTDPECSGWRPAGKLDNDTDVSDSGLNKATHFVKEFNTACGEFLCTYLPRYNVPQKPKETDYMLHGLLCFSKSGCEACAYDFDSRKRKPLTPDDPAKAKDFKDLVLQEKDPKATHQTVNCSGCHRHGPILPKHQLWKDARGELQGLNKLCIEKGGPKWLCHDADKQWLPPTPGDRIKKGDISATFDATCHKGGCHAAGFMPKPVPPNDKYFCGIMRAVFETGGAMNEAGYKFSKDDCIAFMKKMGCDAKDLAKWCSDKNVATQP